MIAAFRSLLAGLRAVLLAPHLLAVAALAMLVIAVPFGVLLGSRLQTSLANQPPIAQYGLEIDAEWWAEFREHARGLDATFTPTIIGFAAPLDNLSALADGTARPWALAGPVVLGVAIWAWLWGGLIERFARGRAIGVREFARSGWRHAPALMAVSAIGALVSLALYATVHAFLFGPVFRWLADRAASERDAFFWRVALYAVFLALWMGAALVIDYTRVAVVAAKAGVRDGLAGAIGFVRTHPGSVVALYLVCGALFMALLSLYAAAEIYGGTQLGGWRALAIGQGYIFGRLGIRLMLAASEVALFQAATTGAPPVGPSAPVAA